MCLPFLARFSWSSVCLWCSMWKDGCQIPVACRPEYNTQDEWKGVVLLLSRAVVPKLFETMELLNSDFFFPWHPLHTLPVQLKLYNSMNSLNWQNNWQRCNSAAFTDVLEFALPVCRRHPSHFNGTSFLDELTWHRRSFRSLFPTDEASQCGISGFPSPIKAISQITFTYALIFVRLRFCHVTQSWDVSAFLWAFTESNVSWQSLFSDWLLYSWKTRKRDRQTSAMLPIFPV